MATSFEAKSAKLPCVVLDLSTPKNKGLSRPSVLICSGRYTHSGHPSTAGRAQNSGSSPASDQRSTTVLRNQRASGRL